MPSHRQPSKPEPLQSTTQRNKAWEKLKIDFYGPLPTGQYILDCYSRFPKVEVLSSISAKIVIPKLNAVFPRHIVPPQVVSDNGPPFQGLEFNRYMTKIGIQHTTCTPLWRQGNSEVEAFMKPLGKAIRKTHLERRQELSKFLLAHRSTPHSTTKIPPAQLLCNREIRGKLPTLPHTSKVINRHREARQNDQQQKLRGKRYVDSRRHARPCKLRVGDRVLVRQQKTNKFSTNFSPIPYTIIAIKGSKKVARNQQHSITRNVLFFKKTAEQEVSQEESEKDMVRRRQEEDGDLALEQNQHKQQEPRRSTHPINTGLHLEYIDKRGDILHMPDHCTDFN